MGLQKHKEGIQHKTDRWFVGEPGLASHFPDLYYHALSPQNSAFFSFSPVTLGQLLQSSSHITDEGVAWFCKLWGPHFGLHFTQSSNERPGPSLLLFLGFLPALEARNLSYVPSILTSDGLPSRWGALLRNPPYEHRKCPNNFFCAMEKEASNCFLSKWGLHSSWKEFYSLRLLLPQSIEN